MRVRALNQFLQLESASAIILLIMAIVAMIWANSTFYQSQQQFIATFLPLINEGLMTFFFLLVGLELKRGFLDGVLSTLSQIMLPALAAVGGMVVPALFYIAINYHNPMALKGWATPVATDIAFAVGVLSLFGKKVPQGLKLFLLALAVFDDIGAILIIIYFHSHALALLWLMAAIFLSGVLMVLNKLAIQNLGAYLGVGSLLWLTLFYAGIHPTMAGILLALFIPGKSQKSSSPLNRLEDYLHPWVAYLIMPLFALANAGFSLETISLKLILTDTVVMGIVIGLFIGKQVGIFSVVWLLIRSRLAKLPLATSWGQLYGVSLLCGIGFTMSLFLGTLSFQHENIYLTKVRLGVILGSILSGLAGALVLFLAFSFTKNSRSLTVE